MLPLLRVVAAAAANVHSGATGGAHHHLQQALLRAAAVPAVRCGALPCPHTQVVQQHHAAALASSSAPWPSAGAVQQQHQRVQACSTLLQVSCAEHLTSSWAAHCTALQHVTDVNVVMLPPSAQRLRGAAAALPLYACRQHHPAAASWVGANHQQQQQQQQWQQVRGLLGVVSVKNYQDHNQKRPGSKYKIKSPS
jgi:hypothetical protein